MAEANGAIWLAGASRGVGYEIARCLRAQGQPVHALLRSQQAQPELEAMGLSVTVGDALDSQAVTQALTASGPVRAVISTIGGSPQDEQRPDRAGNRNLIDAAVQAGAGRFVLISSIGSGESRQALPQRALEALGPVLADKEQAERHLIASGLPYTIIRPGGLSSEPATDRGILTESAAVAGSITRADVARLVCRGWNADLTRNRVLAAIDRNTAYGDPNFEVLPL